MKKFLLSLSLSLMMTSAMAVPAKSGIWKTIKLENGTEVRAQLKGDEHAHYWMAEDGQRYVEKEDNVFTTISSEEITSRAQARRAVMKNASRLRSPRKVEMGERTSYFGKKKGLVILAQFTDKKFQTSNNLALYKRIMNEEGFNEGNFVGSVSDYFKAQSAGQFELEFDVVGPYTMNNSYSYYGKNDNSGNDTNPEAMIIEACNQANAEVNFADYDWDDDGAVDQVFVLYAGTGEADGGSKSTIWPHMYYLSATNRQLTLDGVTVDTYACSNEVTPNNAIEGIGCFCHEFSHCMGFPDFYDTAYNGWFGMDAFDLMCSGSYNGNTFIPAGYTAHEKMMCGWQDPIVLSDKDTTVTSLQPMSNNGETFIIYNDGHTDEYFMIENRQKSGWDAGYPARGLMITHVDFDKNIWEFNCPNTEITATSVEHKNYGYPLNDHQRMTIVHADNDDDSKYFSSYYGGYTNYTTSTDLYPYSKNDSLTPTSKPAPKLYNNNKKGKKTVEWAITNIKQNANGTMEFKYRAPGSSSGENPDTIPTPGPTPDGDALFYESFDQCTGTGGKDGSWSGTVAQATFNPDNEGWTTLGNCAYGAYGCARFGKSEVSGIVSTPQFTINGSATLTFEAGAWNAKKDGTTLLLEVTNGFTVTPSELTMTKGAWTSYTATIEGTGNVKLTFSPANRFFLDEVKVVENASTGIKTVKSATQAIRIYTLDGRYVGSDKNALPRGMYIINGKKVIR
ncbi:MAG: M6 family metalloprotease domain-containing protein [Prevotella sp.]|nr:M6 family metalloprotease domain-containing protein [Prevotella sp.]